MILRLSSDFFCLKKLTNLLVSSQRSIILTKLRCLQDLFDDSEPMGATTEQDDEKPNSPLEEDFAPSLHAMNLKLDSGPVDDRLVGFSLSGHLFVSTFTFLYSKLFGDCRYNLIHSQENLL